LKVSPDLKIETHSSKKGRIQSFTIYIVKNWESKLVIFGKPAYPSLRDGQQALILVDIKIGVTFMSVQVGFYHCLGSKKIIFKNKKVSCHSFR